MALTVNACAQSSPFQQVTTPAQFSTDNSFAIIAFPSMVTLSSGKILNFYREGQSSIDKGVIALQTSTDKGATWSNFSGTGITQPGDPVGTVFSDATQDVRNQSVNVLPNGNIWVAYNVTTPITEASRVVNMAQSTDSGVTWTNLGQMTSSGVTVFAIYSQLMIVPSGVGSTQCPTGCLVALILDASDHLWLLFSTDNGHTWPTSKSFPANNGGVPTEEEAMLWLNGDTFIGFARSADVQTPTNSPIRFLYTTDAGTTWTISTTNIVFTPNPNIAVFLYDLISPVMVPSPMADGSYVCIFAERQQDVNFITNSQYYVRAITFKPAAAIANPNGFSATQYLYSYNFHAGLNNFGYPAVTTLASGNWLFEFFEQPNSSTWRLFTFTAAQTAMINDTGVAFSGGVTVQ